MSKHHVMLASSSQLDHYGFTYPIMLQPKLDGIRCVLIDGEPYSRNMKPIRNQQVRHTFARMPSFMKNYVLDGELYAHGLNFNQIQDVVMEEKADLGPEFRYVVWDAVNPELWMQQTKHPKSFFSKHFMTTEYRARFNTAELLIARLYAHKAGITLPRDWSAALDEAEAALAKTDHYNTAKYTLPLLHDGYSMRFAALRHEVVNRLHHDVSGHGNGWWNFVQLIQNWYVGNPFVASRLYSKLLAAGYEGAMVKSPFGPYKWGRCTLREGYLIKWKPTFDLDLPIREVVEGDGKRKGMVGAIGVDVASVRVYPGPGKGVTDAHLIKWWRKRRKLIGRTLEMYHSGVTADGSLRFPKFKTIRRDK